MTVFELKMNPYLITVYRADRVKHDEPYTLAWEITNPESDNPYKYLFYSTKDYGLNNICGATQDAVGCIWKKQEKE